MEKLEQHSEEYWDIQKQIELLEAQKDRLRVQIESMLPPEGYAATFGSFGWMTRRKYEYSPKIKELEEQVKKEKKIQELEGAKCTETKSLVVRLY